MLGRRGRSAILRHNYKDRWLVNVARMFLIAVCYTSLFVSIRRAAIKCLNSLPAFNSESGGFRTDVAYAAIGMLRAGDLEEFERKLGEYPFPECWHGIDQQIFPYFEEGCGWKVGTTFAECKYGKAVLQHIDFKTAPCFPSSPKGFCFSR